MVWSLVPCIEQKYEQKRNKNEGMKIEFERYFWFGLISLQVPKRIISEFLIENKVI